MRNVVELPYTQPGADSEKLIVSESRGPNISDKLSALAVVNDESEKLQQLLATVYSHEGD
jgi:hypothetical protein